MPLYEFECLECGREFETLVLKTAEMEKVKCPACESRKLEEKLSTFASVSRNDSSGSANCTPAGG